MKKYISLLLVLTTTLMVANTKVDISYKLVAVYENTVIDGLAENAEEGAIFITESLHLQDNAVLKIKNACLLITGDLTGNGSIEIDDSATVMLQGEESGKITFLKNVLADDTCQQSSGEKSFQFVTQLPRGLRYSVYTKDTKRLVFKGEVDDYLVYLSDKKPYYIKVEGYKLREITFGH